MGRGVGGSGRGAVRTEDRLQRKVQHPTMSSWDEPWWEARSQALWEEKERRGQDPHP